jgi:hypothetical protein
VLKQLEILDDADYNDIDDYHILMTQHEPKDSENFEKSVVSHGPVKALTIDTVFT